MFVFVRESSIKELFCAIKQFYVTMYFILSGSIGSILDV